jgi:hypothetical protein
MREYGAAFFAEIVALGYDGGFTRALVSALRMKRWR